jgi:PAS domain S-box-containing protein
MITVSANGFIESFNPSATRLFGWPENKAVGKPFLMLIEESDRLRCSQLFNPNMHDPARNSPCALGEVQSLRQDGSTFVADASVSRFGSKRRPTIVTVLRDVTDRKESRDMASMLIEASPDAMFGPGRIAFSNGSTGRWR